MFNQTAMDPSCSPPGTNLHVIGAVIPGEKGRPGFAQPVWRRRHLVFEPSFGVMWNITAFGDPALARYSFGAMKELRAELSR